MLQSVFNSVNFQENYLHLFSLYVTQIVDHIQKLLLDAGCTLGRGIGMNTRQSAVLWRSRQRHVNITCCCQGVG